ncbi:MAG: response regulator [Verrucomicrobiota bacterium]
MSKVLLIDDDDNFRQVITQFLAKRGFEIAEASGGREGLRLATREPPDLIVCDQAMPDLDGHGVMAALRRDPRLAEIPVIFLTGEFHPQQVRMGMNLGADDYLTKPVNLQDLLDAINARLTRYLSSQERQEKQMARARQMFAEAIHDLRDPLFVIFGYTNMLQCDPGLGSPGGSEGKPILDRMQQAMVRMQTILADTMFLARSRSQRLPFDPGPFELREFCESLVANHDECQRLAFNCAPGVFPVIADALRLRQALENLLANALKYSTASVLVTLRTALGGYQIEVEDQGIGIPLAEQANIFEPFFRASNTTGTPGHGLGLSIVKSCLEQHGGSVRFLSDGQRGTTFILELPAAASRPDPLPAKCEERARLPVVPAVLTEAPAGEPRRGRAAVVQGGGRLRGVIIDDDSLVRGVLRDLVEVANDVEIVGEASTVAQARVLVRHQVPDVVFLDVNLPDGSGFDLLPDLKPNASVIFVTSAEEYAVQAFDCEAADYLLKPVSAERLRKALARVRQRLSAQVRSARFAGSQLDDSFLVKTLTEKRLVRVGDIRRIAAYGEYSWVYWDKGKGALLRKSLKQWVSELPGAQFVRVHRRAIVNLAFMERLEKLPAGRMQIHLRDTVDPILVSLRLAPALNRKLKH